MNQKGFKYGHGQQLMESQPSLNQSVGFPNFTSFLPYNSNYCQGNVKF